MATSTIYSLEKFRMTANCYPEQGSQLNFPVAKSIYGKPSTGHLRPRYPTTCGTSSDSPFRRSCESKCFRVDDMGCLRINDFIECLKVEI